MTAESQLILQFAEKIRRHDPEVADSVRQRDVAAAVRGAGLEMFVRDMADADPTPSADRLRLETLVVKQGRPILAVRGDRYVIRESDDISPVWRQRLETALPQIRRAIPAVGRIEVKNHPYYEWIGTGWLVDPVTLVTNRHVAQEFAYRSDEEFRFSQGLDPHKLISARIDFREEHGSSVEEEVQVVDVLHIEDAPGPDIAFLRIRQSDRARLPIRLAAIDARRHRFVAAIGYPARDSRIPDQVLVQQILGDIYDKKRLAPGQILRQDDNLVAHDCSTTGGNSGSVVLDLDSGEALAVHFAGLYLRENLSVSSRFVRHRLDEVSDRSRLVVGPISGPNPEPPAGSDRPAEMTVTSDGMNWTIPIHVNIRLGTPVAVPASGARAVEDDTGRPPSVSEAAAELTGRLAGRSEFVGARPGYQFRNGWITKDRAVVVIAKTRDAAAALRSELGEEMAGFPLDVIPAAPEI